MAYLLTGIVIGVIIGLIMGLFLYSKLDKAINSYYKEDIDNEE